MAEKDDEKTIAEDIVVTKYKTCGIIANDVLSELVRKCVVNASVRELCEEGDRLIEEKISAIFKKEKNLRKGISFPTCISVNHCVCHFSPCPFDTDYVLKSGDVVKIDLGAHIDGFIAVVAHTVVIGANKNNKVSGMKANAILAAHYASEVALRLVQPGNENVQVTEAVQNIAEAFDCHPVEGMLSHQLQQFRIDGKKTIIQNPNEQQKRDQEKENFEMHEVYAVDVLISTGEGQAKEQEDRATIYKKTDAAYNLKLKASRAFLSEADKRFQLMPFHLRNFSDQKKAKMGLIECITHKLVEPFHVLYEKPGEFVAQFKFTVLLMKTGSHKITGLPFNKQLYNPEKELKDETLLKLLAEPVDKKELKKQKRKAKQQLNSAGDPPQE